MQELTLPRHRFVSARLYEEGVEKRPFLGAPRFLRWSDIVDVRYSATEALLIGREAKVRVVYGEFRNRDEVPDLLDRHVPRQAVESLIRHDKAQEEKYARGLKGSPLLFVLFLNIYVAWFAARFVATVSVPRALLGDWFQLAVIAVFCALWFPACECWKRSKSLGAIAEVILFAMAWFGRFRQHPWDAAIAVGVTLLFWAIAVLATKLPRSRSHQKD
jgi:hypothetical protein